MDSLTRRQLLKHAGLTLAGLAAASCVRLDGEKWSAGRARPQVAVGSSAQPIDDRTFERFLDLLDGRMFYDVPQIAFSTHDSWIGLVKNGRLGLEELHGFYGRKPRLLSPALLTFDLEYRRTRGPKPKIRQTNNPLAIEETDGHGFRGVAAFLTTDVLCYHLSLDERGAIASVTARFNLPAATPGLPRRLRFVKSTNRLTIETRLPRTDPRDPAPDHPFTCCLIAPPGFGLLRAATDDRDLPIGETGLDVAVDGAVSLEFRLSVPGGGVSEQTFVVGLGEGETAGEIESRVAGVSEASSRKTREASRNWLRASLDRFAFDGVPKSLQRHYAMAAYQLLANTKAPRGRLKHRAAFPSRGKYCSHYLWDSCFATLGAAQFNQNLAQGYLLNLCENQEADGKIPQFICSSWNRPGESQAPLLGWAAWGLFERFGDRGFLEKVYEPLRRVVTWWLENRDSDRDGIVEYNAPLESGWDNSPRFDKGKIAGVDLNAYLNREMLILSRIAALLGKPDEAKAWEARRAQHAARMLERLFDPRRRLFFDRLVDQDKLSDLLTPASFAPLWTGVPLDPALAREMIVRYLLDPKRFFGRYPFPVVAYDQPVYNAADWWRGPVWVNIAWEMSEVLRLHGFEKEREAAVRRLIRMMTRDLKLAELYNSATGEPEGCWGYGWTCAAFMDLVKTQRA